MKKILLFCCLCLCLTAVGQELKSIDTDKIYKVEEVETAPQFLNLPLIDSLTSVQNFKHNLRIFLGMNLKIIMDSRRPERIEKAYVQFVIKKDGSIQITNSRATAKIARKFAVEAVTKIKKMIPATIQGKNVAVKVTIPVKFHTYSTIKAYINSN